MERFRRRAALAVVSLSAGLLAAPALASRAPTRAQRRALIGAAVCRTPVAYCRGALVRRVRVSTKGPYALVAIGARRGSQYQANSVLLRHRRRWRIVAIISAQGVPCSVPRSVFVDLHLARYNANGNRCV